MCVCVCVYIYIYILCVCVCVYAHIWQMLSKVANETARVNASALLEYVAFTVVQGLGSRVNCLGSRVLGE